MTVAVNTALPTVEAELGMNLDETPELHPEETMSAESRARWLAENREALQSHDRFVERHGLWSDGLRQF